MKTSLSLTQKTITSLPVLSNNRTVAAHATVRRATRDDFDTIVHFNLDGAYESARAELNHHNLCVGVPYSLRCDSDFYLVCESEGEIVGHLKIHQHWHDWYDQHLWWIEHVYVPERHRGKGYAQQMIDQVCRLAREDACVRHVLLMVRSDNTPAVQLYEKTGFGLHRNTLMFRAP